MRDDGRIEIYRVQHREISGQQAWSNSNIGHFLFEKLRHAEARGAKGDRYRALIAPTNECWQHTGEHAFLHLEDACAARDAMKAENPNRQFRVVLVRMTKETEVVA